MFATSKPKATTQPPHVASPSLAFLEAQQRLRYIVTRLTRSETPTVEKANLYGQQDSLNKFVDWMEGILTMELPDGELSIHLRTLATFLSASYKSERRDATNQEKRGSLNSLEWRNLTTGRLQGYEYALTMLNSLGISPIR